MIEFIKAFFFGIVEGITEWLPVSSTGHLILFNEFVNLNVSKEFYSLFEVVIQLGAILAVVLIFWKEIWPLGLKEFKGAHASNTTKKIYWKKDILNLWVKIIIACIPAMLTVPFNDKFEEKFYNFVPVSIALIVFGVAFILIENRNKTAKILSVEEINYKTALMIGLFQVLAAVFPGTSRSGATIIGALLIGVSRPAAASFTFYLAIPVMGGASLLKLLKFGLSFTSDELIILLIGTVTAFVVSIFVIKFLMSYIKKHDFKIFGYYRIVLGILLLLYYFIIK